MKNAKPTMADVAKLARVSPTTAARVVHANGYVSEANRKAVQAAVAKLGYRPNLQARALRMRRSQTLGLVYSDVHNPLFSKLSHELRLAAFRAGYSVLAVDHDSTGEGEAAGIAQLIDHRVDFVICFHAYDPAAYEALGAAAIPIIQIERKILGETHFVAYDQRPGMEQAVAALAARGHRRIGYIGGRPEAVNRPGSNGRVEAERAALFAEAAASHGLAPADCPQELGPYVAPDEAGRLSGQRLARKLLAAAPDLTAIVAGSDVLAAGILHELYDRRLRVPDDLSLIGYDDAIADLLAPQLTTIQQPFRAIAAAAIDIVTSYEEGGPLLTREVPTRLVERRSVGPAGS